MREDSTVVNQAENAVRKVLRIVDTSKSKHGMSLPEICHRSRLQRDVAEAAVGLLARTGELRIRVFQRGGG